MSGNFVRASRTRAPAAVWTDAQLAFLFQEWSGRTDPDLAEELSRLGPTVDLYAVQDKRLSLGLRKPKGFHPDNARASAMRTNEMHRRAGWPVIRKDSVKRGLERMFEELRAEHSRLRSCPPAQREVA